MHTDQARVSRLSTALLWLFVIILGIALGAGLYESRIVVPDWIGAPSGSLQWNAEAARHDDTGRRFWVAVTTVPLTLLTFTNIVAAWRAPRRLRRWWMAAAFTGLADRVFTLSYFVPTMVLLMRAESTPGSLSTALRWIQLNHLRHIIVFVAFLTALKTFALMYAYSASRTMPAERDTA